MRLNYVGKCQVKDEGHQEKLQGKLTMNSDPLMKMTAHTLCVNNVLDVFVIQKLFTKQPNYKNVAYFRTNLFSSV